MRSVLGVVVCAFAAAVSAVSTTGNRLLVVLDDAAEKDAYSQFFGDLTGEDPRAGLQLGYADDSGSSWI
ncbi:hypothetical protein C2W62_50310 [Candidatus Entotheonella serta]|nr:hypothetical protein C2W62_50310 [Candidatus Entotheonella serta]